MVKQTRWNCWVSAWSPYKLSSSDSYHQPNCCFKQENLWNLCRDWFKLSCRIGKEEGVWDHWIWWEAVSTSYCDAWEAWKIPCKHQGDNCNILWEMFKWHGGSAHCLGWVSEKGKPLCIEQNHFLQQNWNFCLSWWFCWFVCSMRFSCSQACVSQIFWRLDCGFFSIYFLPTRDWKGEIKSVWWDALQ